MPLIKKFEYLENVNSLEDGVKCLYDWSGKENLRALKELMGGLGIVKPYTLKRNRFIKQSRWKHTLVENSDCNFISLLRNGWTLVKQWRLASTITACSRLFCYYFLLLVISFNFYKISMELL